MRIEDIKLGIPRQLQNKLRATEKLSVAQAAILADNVLNRFENQAREGVLLWLNDKLTDEFAVGGLSVGEVRRMTGVSPFEALCFLDIHMKNPDFAEREVQWFERRYDG